ncbi:MAG: hypothetical protein AAFR17_04680 [Pseudomonadota bacterium]
MSVAADVLIKKVEKARVSRSPITQLDLIGDAFVRELDDRLRVLINTITSTMVIDCEVRKLSSVLEEIPVPAMLALINVERSKNKALINISNDLLFHIVDLRLGGDPSAVPIPTARSITEIDCGLCADFINCMLTSFTEALVTALEAPSQTKLSLATFEEHATLLAIAPDNADVLVLNASLDMGEAARSGDFELIIPLSVLDIFKSSAKKFEPRASTAAASDLWQRHMSEVAASTKARLYSVMHRMPMQVSDLQALKPGQMLEIPGSCRHGISLCIDSTDPNDTLAIGQLGALSGKKAVKLIDPPSEAFQARLRRMIEINEEP